MKATDVTQHSLDVPKSALAAENPILGTWKLRSLVFEVSATGERSSPFGDHPDGYLSYSPDGRMYAVGVVEDRPKPRDVVPTDEEKVKLQGSMFAYAGTYTADGEKVVHHVDISWNQSWTGTDLVRFYKLDGNTLTITTARAQSAFDGEEGEFILAWEKVTVGNLKPTMQVYAATLTELVRDVAQSDGAKPALIFADQPISYADLDPDRASREWIGVVRNCAWGPGCTARAEHPRVRRRVLRRPALWRNRCANQCAL